MKTKLLKKVRKEYSIYKGNAYDICDNNEVIKYEYYDVRLNGKKINMQPMPDKECSIDIILYDLRKRFPNLGKRRVINGTVKIWP